jgi:hypothetical protein
MGDGFWRPRFSRSSGRQTRRCSAVDPVREAGARTMTRSSHRAAHRHLPLRCARALRRQRRPPTDAMRSPTPSGAIRATSFQANTVRGREHQSSHQTRNSCKGRRPHRNIGAMEVAPVSTGFVAEYRLAGKTAINSATSPQAAFLRVCGTRSPIPPRISKTPLINTIGRCHGTYGGMILT